MLLHLGLYLPSPYTASFQALSVNAFRWRIRYERPGDASKTFSDHVTRNASAAHTSQHPSYHTLHNHPRLLAARFVPLFHVNRIVAFTMFLESNRKIGVEKLIPIVKLFLMSIRDIFEMLNSRIQRDTLCALFRSCSRHHQLLVVIERWEFNRKTFPLQLKQRKIAVQL